MSKNIYKGYELIKAIAEGEIKEGSRFKVKALWNGSYFYYNRIAIVKYKNIVYEEEEEIITSWTIINSEFELIEDETIDIESINELLKIEPYEADKTDIVINRNKINEILKWAKQQEKRIKKIGGQQMLSKEEREKAKECLQETIQNTYAEGKAIKLNNVLKYIDQLESDKQKLIEKLEKDIREETGYAKWTNSYTKEISPAVTRMISKSKYAQEILSILKGER